MSAQAATVFLQQPTATISQGIYYHPSEAIDGITSGNNGWAIGSSLSPQTAVFETVSNVGTAPGSIITFTIIQDMNQHSIGRFRISITNDDRSLFADGLTSGGDVTANWTVLDPSSYTALNGTTLTKLGDLSILASGTVPSAETYTISMSTVINDITGVRIEAIPDPSLPLGGSGRFSNANFVITEFQMDIVAVPEPSSLLYLICGLAGVLFHRRRFI